VATVCLAAACEPADTGTPTAGPVPGAAATVQMVGSPETVGAFRPAVVAVQVGQAVAWVNVTGNYHTVSFTSRDVRSSGGIAPGRTFEVTFDRPGRFRYQCDYHPGMVGEVRVSGPASAARGG
jgi:plastocyanin